MPSLSLNELSTLVQETAILVNERPIGLQPNSQTGTLCLLKVAPLE